MSEECGSGFHYLKVVSKTITGSFSYGNSLLVRMESDVSILFYLLYITLCFTESARHETFWAPAGFECTKNSLMQSDALR